MWPMRMYCSTKSRYINRRSPTSPRLRRASRGGGMVYAEDLKSLTRKGLWVRVPPPAPKLPTTEHASPSCCFCRGGTRKILRGTRSAEWVAKSGPRKISIRRKRYLFLAESTSLPFLDLEIRRDDVGLTSILFLTRLLDRFGKLRECQHCNSIQRLQQYVHRPDILYLQDNGARLIVVAVDNGGRAMYGKPETRYGTAAVDMTHNGPRNLESLVRGPQYEFIRTQCISILKAHFVIR